MRTPAINLVLEETISRQRLGRYLTATGGELDAALALYERNFRISEAFYTPLQCLEICVRNRFNDVLCATYGADWFQNGNPHLGPDALAMIAGAVAQLGQARKPVTTGAIVAELSFGFWVGLVGPRYDHTLWRTALHRAFQQPLRRKLVHGRLNALRRFRNRIAHHEPIWFRPLWSAHDEIVEAIGWLSPATSAWTLHHSRVPEVLRAERVAPLP
jgi:hypothetical protein